MGKHSDSGTSSTVVMTTTMTAKEQKKIMRQKKWKENIKLIKQNWILYLFILPSFLYLIIFNYAPMYGVQIAFRDYNFVDGILGSEWVGLKWFTKFFDAPRFWTLMKNTLKLSVYGLIAGFPLPVVLAADTEERMITDACRLELYMNTEFAAGYEIHKVDMEQEHQELFLVGMSEDGEK